jgi:3-oxoacyl-[acyl-carrier protein] reductase
LIERCKIEQSTAAAWGNAMKEALPRAREWTFGELSVGQVFSIEHVFDSEDVQRFASLSGDFSPLHVDPEYGATTEFGSCVVHGMLLASLFSQLVGMHVPGKHALYLGQDLSFRKPVRVGERVQAIARITGKNDATYSLLLTTEIRNAEDKIVVSGTAKVKVRDAEADAVAVRPQREIVPARAGQHVALITGGSRGIGAEIATTLAARGTAVAINYRESKIRAEALAQKIRDAGGAALAVQADVRDKEESLHMIEQVADRCGGLDWIVNGAIAELPSRPFSELDWTDFEAQLEYQVKGVMNICQAAYPSLKRVGGGAIVNLLSQVVHGQPPARMASYVTAKYALQGLSKALAIEWAEDQIRVNTVSPGLVQTDLTQHIHERIFKMEGNRTPLKRIAQPGDVARAVAFLLSEEAAFLTGVDLSVTGGQVMR